MRAATPATTPARTPPATTQPVGGYGCTRRRMELRTVGVALLGTLTSHDATPAARDALTRLLAWEASRNGINPEATEASSTRSAVRRSRARTSRATATMPPQPARVTPSTRPCRGSA